MATSHVAVAASQVHLDATRVGSWQASSKPATGDVAQFGDALQRPSITQALMDARAEQGGQQWYCGGPRSSFVYKPPHHRYRTDKTICKVLYNADGTISSERVPTNVSNTKELWSGSASS